MMRRMDKPNADVQNAQLMLSKAAVKRRATMLHMFNQGMTPKHIAREMDLTTQRVYAMLKLARADQAKQAEQVSQT